MPRITFSPIQSECWCEHDHPGAHISQLSGPRFATPPPLQPKPAHCVTLFLEQSCTLHAMPCGACDTHFTCNIFLAYTLCDNSSVGKIALCMLGTHCARDAHYYMSDLYTLCRVHFSLHSVQCTQKSAKYTLSTVWSTLKKEDSTFQT